MGITVSNTQVKDSSGTLLGYLVTADASYVTILTSSDYLISLAYDGSAAQNAAFHYTSNDCTGTFYKTGAKNYGKAVITDSSGNNYVPKSVTNGIATSSTLTFNSFQTVAGGSCNASTTTTAGYELKTTTFQEIGLPTTISAPISFNHQ